MLYKIVGVAAILAWLAWMVWYIRGWLDMLTVTDRMALAPKNMATRALIEWACLLPILAVLFVATAVDSGGTNVDWMEKCYGIVGFGVFLLLAMQSSKVGYASMLRDRLGSEGD